MRSPLVVVGDLYVKGVGGRPNEADTVLVIDPYGVLAESVVLQRMKV